MQTYFSGICQFSQVKTVTLYGLYGFVLGWFFYCCCLVGFWVFGLFFFGKPLTETGHLSHTSSVPRQLVCLASNNLAVVSSFNIPVVLSLQVFRAGVGT